MVAKAELAASVIQDAWRQKLLMNQEANDRRRHKMLQARQRRVQSTMVMVMQSAWRCASAR